MIRGYETSGRSRYSRQRVHPLPSSARRSPQLTTARANRNAAARLGPARRTAMRQSTTPRLLARLRSSFRTTAPVIPTATSFPTTDEIRAAMMAHYDRRASRRSTGSTRTRAHPSTPPATHPAALAVGRDSPRGVLKSPTLVPHADTGVIAVGHRIAGGFARTNLVLTRLWMNIQVVMLFPVSANTAVPHTHARTSLVIGSAVLGPRRCAL